MNHKFHLLILQESCPSIDSIFKAPPNSEAPFSIAEVQAAINKFPHVVDALVYINTSGAVDPIPPTRQFTGFGNNGREGSISPATLASKNTEEESFYDRCHKDLQFSISQAISRFKALGLVLILGEVSFEVFMQQWLIELNTNPPRQKSVDHKNQNSISTLFTLTIKNDIICGNPETLSIEEIRRETLNYNRPKQKFFPIVWINAEAKKTKPDAFKTATTYTVFSIEEEKKEESFFSFNALYAELSESFYKTQDTLFGTSKPVYDHEQGSQCLCCQPKYIVIETPLSFNQLAQEWPKKKGLRLEIHTTGEKIQIFEGQSIAATFQKIEEVTKKSWYTSIKQLVADGLVPFNSESTDTTQCFYFCESKLSPETKKIMEERKKTAPSPILFIFGEKLYLKFCWDANTDKTTLRYFQTELDIIKNTKIELTEIEKTLETIKNLVALQTISFDIPNATNAREECIYLQKKLKAWLNNFGEYDYDYIDSTKEFYEHFSSLDKNFYPYHKNIYHTLKKLDIDLEKRITVLISIYDADQFLSGELYSNCQHKINELKKLKNDLLTRKEKLEKLKELTISKKPYALNTHACLNEYISFLENLNQWPLDLEKMEIANELFILKSKNQLSTKEEKEPNQKILALEQKITVLKGFDCQFDAVNALENKYLKSRLKSFIYLRFDFYKFINSYLNVSHLANDEKAKLNHYLQTLKEIGPHWSGVAYNDYSRGGLDEDCESLKNWAKELFLFEEALAKKNNFLVDQYEERKIKRQKIIADLAQLLLIQAIEGINDLRKTYFLTNITEETTTIVSSYLHRSFFFALQEAFLKCGIASTVSYTTHRQLTIVTPPEKLHTIILSDKFSNTLLKDAYQVAYVPLLEEDDRLEKKKNSEGEITVTSAIPSLMISPLTSTIIPASAETHQKKQNFHIPTQDPLAEIQKPQILKKKPPFAWSTFWRALAAPIIEITFLRSPPFWMWTIFLGVMTGVMLQTWAPTAFTLSAPYLMVFLSLSICAAAASLLVCAIVKADKSKAATEAEAKTEIETDSEIVAYFKNRFAWMHEHRILAALIIAAVIGTVLGITFIPETGFSALVHSVCMIFLGESSPFAIEVISTIMMTATAILLPLLIGEGIMHAAMTATEVAESAHARENAQEDECLTPTTAIKLDSDKVRDTHISTPLPIFTPLPTDALSIRNDKSTENVPTLIQNEGTLV